MSQTLSTTHLNQLPVAERLRLTEELWQSLDTVGDALPVPDWQRAELDKRLDAFERDPSLGRPWPEVRAEILAALRK